MEFSDIYVFDCGVIYVLSLLTLFFSKLLLIFDILSNSTLSVVVEFSKLTIAMPLSWDFFESIFLNLFFSVQIYFLYCLLIVSLKWTFCVPCLLLILNLFSVKNASFKSKDVVGQTPTILKKRKLIGKAL